MNLASKAQRSAYSSGEIGVVENALRSFVASCLCMSLLVLPER